MKYFIIAGEQSGDLHGSNLVRELLAKDREAEIKCWGGDLMVAAGATLLMHYRQTAFMGVTAIIKNLGKIFRNLKICGNQITDYKPDVVILIDYPGFNLRIARFARNSGFRVFYYISPKFWAWNEKRVVKVRRYVNKMYIIFPFETGFYEKYGIPVRYMGNPLVDEIDKRISAIPERSSLKGIMNLDERPVIGILAGSRMQEVAYMLPQMIKVVKYFPEYQFVVAGVKNLPDDLYNKIIANENVRIVRESTYELLLVSEAALVASGTATLETALLGIPQVVCYRSDFLTMILSLMVLRVKYISLVNLIMESEVIKELLGYKLNRKNLVRELKRILPGSPERERILDGYRIVKERLGSSGASARIAADMVATLKAS
ncbi:MAG: lipid-A-disaccharide synthase [Bacteroidales bacterium]|jgi:lipid-A-disaccharide synthase